MNLLKQRKFQIAVLFLVFGIMTVVSGGRSLFTEEGITTRGNIVPLVLWFNFIAGFFYLLAGVSTFKMKTCVKKLSVVLASLSSIVLLYLAVHIYQGGLYETKTVVAMSFRTFFWIAFAVYFHRSDFFSKTECRC